MLCNAVLSALQPPGSPNIYVEGSLRTATAWRHALSFLFDISRLKLCPDLVSYSSAMSALGKASLWQEALVLLELSGAREALQPAPWAGKL